MTVKTPYVSNAITYAKRALFYSPPNLARLVFRFNLRKRGLSIGFRGTLHPNEVWPHLVLTEVFTFRISPNYVPLAIFSGESINLFGLMWDARLCVGINISY